MEYEVRRAILPAADGQTSIATRHPASYQDAITAAASVAEQWLAQPLTHSLVDLLNHWMERMPGSARTPFQEAFLMRLEQRLRAFSTARQALINDSSHEKKSAASVIPQQSVEGLNYE
ncbi:MULTISPECIES: hypothetical protein [unclassified Pseudomonas]|uniref:hypothetical protein n=1 Tax=unclassified Pseudomonas TaxID=196821 RepID=UPI000C87C848|nr:MULTISPECIES: hypothetical protein [unclassified Pseudomonas]PMU11723.1 hypothetical protein C1Y11_04090 [Pseudomonas sp. FW305-20]PMU15389.1 hypothetical protein C1Y10_22480 [Pseudomonas sp. FW305-122]PMU43232.1 hypothetical protein C1Y12_03435 [Pseudomonas sp. FW305-47B]PMX63523.1 hypothetical protein C1X12_22620 [Pseudomonas sp. FW305-60]PMX64557.1 hypothetical protein C1Y13_04230 [Pseudomonas sp. FW305-33]